jgi:chromosome segregation ATPase
MRIRNTCRTDAGCRDNLRLKGEKLHDTNVITRLKKKLTQTESKLSWHKERAEELQKKLSEQAMEKDASALVIESLKNKVRELETVGFVMTDRANRFSEEVKPRRMEVTRLTEQRSIQDKELARTLRLVDKLRGSSQQKDMIVQYALQPLCLANSC